MMFYNLFLTTMLFFLMPNRGFNLLQWVILAMAVGPPTVVAAAQFWLDRVDPLKPFLKSMFFLILLHHGLVLNNTYAVFCAIFIKSHSGTFDRTPKFGQTKSWVKTNYGTQLGITVPWFELGMIGFLAAVIWSGLHYEVHHPTYPWLLTFISSFCFVVYLQMSEYWSKLKKISKQNTRGLSSYYYFGENEKGKKLQLELTASD